MQEKARLVLESKELTDLLVRSAHLHPVQTGWKWRAQVKGNQENSRLQHQEVVSRIQTGRISLGWGEVPSFWSKASREKTKAMVVVWWSRSTTRSKWCHRAARGLDNVGGHNRPPTLMV